MKDYDDVSIRVLAPNPATAAFGRYKREEELQALKACRVCSADYLPRLGSCLGF